MKISRQTEITVYVSGENNLCLAFDVDDLAEVDDKHVLIITQANVEFFKVLIVSAISDMNNNSLNEMMGG